MVSPTSAKEWSPLLTEKKPNKGSMDTQALQAQPLIVNDPSLPTQRRASVPTQLLIMLWKNCRLKMRKPISFAFEIGLPVAFFGLLVILHGVVTDNDETHAADSGMLGTVGNFSQTAFLAWYLPVPVTKFARYNNLHVREAAKYPRCGAAGC